jgi:hypothetical protein
VRGAAARNWEYWEDEDPESQPQLVLVPQDDYPAEEFYEDEEEYLEDEVNNTASLSPYTTSFVRQRAALPAPATSQPYDYAYTYPSYQETLRPRRQPGFAPLDMALGVFALLPGRWFVKFAVIGLIGFIGWFVVNNGLSFVSNGAADSSRSIYQFTNSGSAQASVSKGAAPATGNNVLGSPSISPEKIDAVLRQYNSPAAGFGKALYDLGVHYGIDPAYALAFFIHESSAGTQGVAAITKSIGNIRCTAGYDCYQTSGNGSFRRYSSWEAGAEDWYKLIKDQYVTRWGLKTLEQIIPVYAPSADNNNPTGYIQQVANMVNSWRNGK